MMERLPANSRRSTTKSTLQVASAATGLARDLTDMLQIAPAAAATSLLLMIFDTIEGIHVNKSECHRLARRCARMLLDIHSAMQGRWHDAPPALNKSFTNLESTLTEIHEFMRKQAALKWHTRMFQKREIDKQIAEYTSQLEDAITSFQATTLINVHYMISKRRQTGVVDEGYDIKAMNTDGSSVGLITIMKPTGDESDDHNADCATMVSSPTITDSDLDAAVDEVLRDSLDWGSRSSTLLTQTHTTLEQKYPTIVEEEVKVSSSQPTDILTEGLNVTDAFSDLYAGYRTCHQSELKDLRRYRIKEGWWSGTAEAGLDDQRLVIKRYDGATEEAKEAWRQDIMFLSKLRHCAFPEVYAISSDTSPIPFVLVSVKTQALPAFMKYITDEGDEYHSLKFVLATFRDILHAGEEVQRIYQLSDIKLYIFLQQCTFRVTMDGKIIIGPSSLVPSSLNDISGSTLADSEYGGHLAAIREILLRSASKALDGPGSAVINRVYAHLVKYQQQDSNVVAYIDYVLQDEMKIVATFEDSP